MKPTLHIKYLPYSASCGRASATPVCTPQGRNISSPRRSKSSGLTVPILITSDKRIIGGHLRAEAAQAAGLTTVPVIRVDHLSKEQMRALALADNKIALNARGIWITFSRRSSKSSSAKDLSFDIEITGFRNRRNRSDHRWASVPRTAAGPK